MKQDEDGNYLVSQWPKYRLGKSDHIRPLALWSEENDCIITHEEGEIIQFTDIKSFIREITNRRLLIFVDELTDHNKFHRLKQFLDDSRVRAVVCRTRGVVGLYIKSRFSCWIIQRSTWDGKGKPDKQFLDTMKEVFIVNGRCAATPGSLGERKIIETLPHGTRYNRPSRMLRTNLLSDKVGGRADTKELGVKRKVLYERDINSGYPHCSRETIDPGEKPKRFLGALPNGFECFSYWANASVQLPIGVNIPRFGPLPRRRSDNNLEFPTTPNENIDGWWWREELDRARNAGYRVDIREGYFWRNSSNWLEQWAVNMYNLRMNTEGDVQNIIKTEMVAAIGRMSMAPEKLTLVHRDQAQEGDIPIMIQDVDVDQSPISEYYIHIEYDIDSCSLTHIGSYILMRCRVLLYDMMLKEEETGNTIVASNFDSYYSLKPSKLPSGKGLGEWKERMIEEAVIEAPRSIRGIREGTPIDKRPGVPRKYRKA